MRKLCPLRFPINSCLTADSKMMKIMTSLIACLLLMSAAIASAESDNGLISQVSQYSVEETVDRFVAAIEKAGLKVFTRIDHAAGADEAGQSLRPTQLIIFGSPKLGTALMISDQRVGIDLPLKALAWKDAEGKVWLSYNNPDYLFGRFAIHDREPAKQKMTRALKKFAQQATNP
jgi:uncharacterized protein (DUF302 family)